MEGVELTAEQVVDAEHLAEATYQKWRAYRGNYPNRLATHRMGKLAEVAVEAWATGLHGPTVEPVFRDLDRDAEADVVIGDCRVEVKSWAAVNWETMGRCVRPNQLRYLEAKARRHRLVHSGRDGRISGRLLRWVVDPSGGA
jgi:hypothetical protein